MRGIRTAGGTPSANQASYYTLALVERCSLLLRAIYIPDNGATISGVTVTFIVSRGGVTQDGVILATFTPGVVGAGKPYEFSLPQTEGVQYVAQAQDVLTLKVAAGGAPSGTFPIGYFQFALAALH